MSIPFDMAAKMTSFALPFARNVGRRLQNTWHALSGPGDLLTLLLAIILLLMPALAINGATWPLWMEIVVPALLLSMILGFIMARSRYDEFFALILSTIYGLFAIFIIAALNQPGGIVNGAASIISRMFSWTAAAFTGGINQDDLVFNLLVAILFWYLSYNAAWHLFRIDRVWRVIVPPGLILVTNTIFYNGPAPLDRYLIIFVFISLLLITRSNLDAREWDWYVNGIRVPRQLRMQFIRVGAALAVIALLIAWAVPAGDLQERLDNFQNFLRSDPLQQIGEVWNRLFSPIESEGPATTDYYGGDSLNLGGAVRLGDQVVMLVKISDANRRYYWRSRVFERYDGSWSPSATTRVPDLAPPLEIVMNEEIIGRSRTQVDQVYTMGIRSRLIYTVAQPFQVDLSGRADVSYTDEPLRNWMNVSVIRPEQVIDRGESYSARSLISTASANELRAASTNYPDWVVNPNLYTGTISPAVAQLANEIVTAAGATNPYDRAKAIERWLRTNITYNESIAAPPPGRDPLEWLLFEVKQGYCTYYATAMIVMLRSMGVPARMASGFAQGEWDAAAQQFIVRERDAHTWVEVYFPGYGWIEFEPTSAQAPLNRDGDDPFQTDQPPVAQVSEPTLTPTATSTPSPTPTPQDTPAGLQQQPLLPTITLTPSPTPTATPVIVPTIAPPIQPQTQSFASFLLSAFGVALLGLLLIVLIVALGTFIWWWWEWRGMRGLSPIARAYARLERYIRLIGIRTGSIQTPEEKRAQIVTQLPASERPVTAITRLYTSERYGAHARKALDNARTTEAVEKAWPDARTRILQRWLRRFLPWRRPR